MIAEPHTPPGFSRLGCRRSIVRIFGMGTRRVFSVPPCNDIPQPMQPRAVPSIYENASVMRKSDCAVSPLEIGFPATYQVAGRVFTRPGRRRSGCAGSPRPVARCRFWPPRLFSVFIDLFGTDALGWAGSALSSRPALGNARCVRSGPSLASASRAPRQQVVEAVALLVLARASALRHRCHHVWTTPNRKPTDPKSGSRRRLHR